MRLTSGWFMLALLLAGCTQETGRQSKISPPYAPEPFSGPAMQVDVRRASYLSVKAFGAAGDGKQLDSPSINNAIEAAASRGGGMVYFPAGNYLCVSIRLKSNVALYLDQGATIVAASPKDGHQYDSPEPNEFDQFQDFGHTHWHNSLIWGENLENVSILGPGKIFGQGLVRSGPGSRSKEQNALVKGPPAGRTMGKFSYPSARDAVEPGWGNKAIALKLCRNVIIRDVTIRKGGHFAILATGVDNLTIDNVKMDTDRDGMDIDCCRNVRISNCSVNSPFDDGICLKSTYALGFNRATENVTITNCQVSGYDEGTFLEGTFKRDYKRYSHNTTTGRLKFGTESNGGFKNITISNCVFSYSRGLALELVDGGALEDVSISNITMRDIVNAPIYLRLGRRNRAPEGTKVGTFRRVSISNVVIYNAPTQQSIIIAGIPNHPIEDVKLDNIRVHYQGGGNEKIAATRPSDRETDYPEPANHGVTPAYGVFARHVRNLEMSDIVFRYDQPDVRPPLVIEQANGAQFNNVKALREPKVPTFLLRDVLHFSTHHVSDIEDTTLETSGPERRL
jgi:polygalacturonase